VVVKVRKAENEDSEFVYRVRKAAFGEYFQPWDDAAQRETHSRRFATQEYRVIEADEVPVGSISLQIEPDCVHLFQLFLLPEFQGRGIGTECMSRLMAEAERLGLPFRLQVRKQNHRARRLYERLGFSITGETDLHDLMEWTAPR
jgi:ribosomal protein S18 acetylase RimI-like enzyme